MKKLIGNLLMGIGIASVGFVAYVLWDDHAKKTEQERESAEAEKRAEFIERRRAYAREKSAVEATEDGTGQEPFTGESPEADASAYELERS